MPFSDLPQLINLLNIKEASLTLVEADMLAERFLPSFNPDENVIIFDILPGEQAGKIQHLLSSIHPKDHACLLVQAVDHQRQRWQKSSVSLNDVGMIDSASCLFVPPSLPDSSLESFQNLIAHLRSPQGCPWDREQTHLSLRPNLLEETYEVIKALDEKDTAGLMEELGDLLLQIVLHSQISTEENEFTLSRVIQGIHRKIVHRHPHVFKDVKIKDSNAVIHKWEELKSIERLESGKGENHGILDSVPRMMPALALAQAYQQRASRVGFDWPEIQPVIDKVYEELTELETAPTRQRREEELGDLLFAVVNLVRWYEVDAESALRKMTTRFYKRFTFIEDQARKQGRKLQEMKLEEMDAIWELAKKNGL
jgi:tetrapyrrole methylase family protein / MazG family protein